MQRGCRQQCRRPVVGHSDDHSICADPGVRSDDGEAAADRGDALGRPPQVNGDARARQCSRGRIADDLLKRGAMQADIARRGISE